MYMKLPWQQRLTENRLRAIYRMTVFHEQQVGLTQAALLVSKLLCAHNPSVQK